MIIDFGDKETEYVWLGLRTNKLPHQIQLVARRKLRMLNNSQNINDLRIPHSNHLEKLVGSYEGFYSIRINNTWRIIFKWNNTNSQQVKIINYH